MIIVGALGSIPKVLEKKTKELEISGKIKVIQTIVLLRLAKMLTRVQKTWDDLLSLRLQWKITC